MKRTLKFDEEWKAAIAMLPQKMQQQLTEAIIRYQQTGEETQLPPVAAALFMVIKCTVDRRATIAARQRERRNKKAESKPAAETREEKTLRIGITLKQNRRLLRVMARTFNIAHADIKTAIDKVIAELNQSGTKVNDTETFLTYLKPHIRSLHDNRRKITA